MTTLKTQRVQRMVALSRRFGTDTLLVQAAGGNVSVKLDKQWMAVKTSGVRLREVSAQKGWAYANVTEIRAGAKKLKGRAGAKNAEIGYADLLMHSNPNKVGPAISMEAGLHAALPDMYVAHTHSIVGMLLGLMPQREAIQHIQRFCGNALAVRFIQPQLPGFALTLNMLQRSDLRNSPLTLWVLQNHGIVWSGAQTQAIWKASEKLEKGLRSFFHFEQFSATHAWGSKFCKESKNAVIQPAVKGFRAWDYCVCHWPVCTFDFRPLFPDLVIYFNLESKRSSDLIRISPRAVRILAKDPRSARDKQEVLLAHVLVSTIAAQNGWHRPLPSAMGRSIKNLETERRRLVQIENH